MIVKTDREGGIKQGKIIHMEFSAIDSARQAGARNPNGAIIIRSLQGKTEVSSSIVNGYITGFHNQPSQRTMVVPGEGELPEVVVIGIRHLEGSFSFSGWCMLQSFFMDSGGGSSGGYYGSLDGAAPSGGGGGGSGSPTNGGSNTGGGAMTEETILIDKEFQDENSAIVIQKYINCFTSIPDAGAKCSIEIMTDIPVDNNPNAFFDIDARSPGHTFLSLSKSNGSQHVTQNIGFYPAVGYKSITFFPTSGKLINNAGHEFNASLSMEISTTQLLAMLNKMLETSNQSYDIELNNCTDWALSVFNLGRTTPFVIPRYPIPTSSTMNLANTPQGLYRKLQEMVANNDAEKGRVTIGIYKGYAGGSNGPCN